MPQQTVVGAPVLGNRRERQASGTATTVQQIANNAGAELGGVAAEDEQAGGKTSADIKAVQLAEKALQKPEKLTALEYGVAVANANADWTRERSATLLAKMNRDHAVVSLGSKVRYLHQALGPDGQPEMRFLNAQDMQTLYEAVLLPIETTTANASGTVTRKKITPAFELWRHWPQRRQYSGIGFFPPPREAPPGWLNLWTGLAIEPKRGDWGLLKEHLRVVVCGGNEQWFEWLLDYMAHAVQRPGEKPGSAVVLYSPEEGTGKTIVNTMMKRIFGQHAMGTAKAEQFLGKFNAAIAAKIWLATEEAFWAGNKQMLGAYKNLITEDRITIEPKGIDPIEVDNFSRVFATTNEKWNTPAGVEGRRFFVLEVKNPRAKDPEYFNPLWDQMEKIGGLQAMLRELLDRKITSDLRNPPETAALMVQRQRTLDGVQQWLWAIANEGELYDPTNGDAILLDETKPTTISQTIVVQAAISELRKMKPGEVRTDLGEILPKLGVAKKQETTGQRRRVYVFPSLHALRDATERELRVEIRS